MKAHILDEQTMRAIGFTDHKKDTWYYVVQIYKHGRFEITFNLRIPKDNPDGFEIDVLDEMFLQPYDYQWMIAETENPPQVAYTVRDRVNGELTKLAKLKIISDWKRGDYV